MRVFQIIVLIGLASILWRPAAAGAQAGTPPPDPKEQLRAFERPKTIPFPTDNPYTPEKAQLGRLLFFDPIISSSGTISCATCHNPGLSWGDGLPRAMGEARKPLPYRSPTVLGVGFAEIFGWDGKFPDLESVAFTPITGNANMNRSETDLIRDLKAIPDYRRVFEMAWPGEGVTRTAIEQALATYERTLLPGRSAFDRWVEGDERAMTDSAKRGFLLFNGRAQCGRCHTGWRLTDDAFHDIGVSSDHDLGRGRLFPQSEALQHAYKTPTLRDVAHRAPFMHDGSIKTLEDVIALYDKGGIERPSRDVLIHPLNLSVAERSDLLAFLETLTGDPVEVAAPVLPR